jgi:hypothetical protein
VSGAEQGLIVAVVVLALFVLSQYIQRRRRK